MSLFDRSIDLINTKLHDFTVKAVIMPTVTSVISNQNLVFSTQVMIPLIRTRSRVKETYIGTEIRLKIWRLSFMKHASMKSPKNIKDAAIIVCRLTKSALKDSCLYAQAEVKVDIMA